MVAVVGMAGYELGGNRRMALAKAVGAPHLEPGLIHTSTSIS